MTGKGFSKEGQRLTLLLTNIMMPFFTSKAKALKRYASFFDSLHTETDFSNVT